MSASISPKWCCSDRLGWTGGSAWRPKGASYSQVLHVSASLICMADFACTSPPLCRMETPHVPNRGQALKNMAAFDSGRQVLVQEVRVDRRLAGMAWEVLSPKK